MSKTVPEVIERHLLQEDRSQAQLARRAGISAKSISRLMNGAPAGKKVCRRLEMAMGLPPGTLIELQAQSATAQEAPDAA